jgi:acyl carrier protein
MKEQIKSIISEVLEIPSREIEYDTTFSDDLGADWVDLEDIRIAIELHYNCELNDWDEVLDIDDCHKLLKRLDAEA